MFGEDMLVVALPYKIEQVGDKTIVEIVPLRVKASCKLIDDSFKSCVSQLEKKIDMKITKSDIEFRDDGTVVCNHWPEVLNLALEYEPLIEVHEFNEDRKKRVQDQDHLMVRK